MGSDHLVLRGERASGSYLSVVSTFVSSALRVLNRLASAGFSIVMYLLLLLLLLRPDITVMVDLA